ncbi:unnamed protein product [Acanthoscelides obtectus]|uniref:Uncharacterized protein n=1 Tax=Acanthoscelides obtectus TaxID=200917 RepID=A0A9P0P4X3_ACAOB|nr:unnamed protein product [Acanthoscelides obtectus]CAK1666844.1 hypothetical protein AOBTE_LOCUS25518 [Acanthoscelides obtectus]
MSDFGQYPSSRKTQAIRQIWFSLYSTLPKSTRHFAISEISSGKGFDLPGSPYLKKRLRHCRVERFSRAIRF